MQLDDNFIVPQYQSECFSNLPGTVLNLLKTKARGNVLFEKQLEKYFDQNYQNVVLLLIDALGYKQWEENIDLPLFSRIKKQGFAAPIISVFPSTTSSALSTLHSGLTPAEHGLFEWTLYLPEIKETIETLPFKKFGSKKADSLLEEQVQPKVLFNQQTIYQVLKKNGVKSFTFTHKSYIDSAYSKVARRGSVSIEYMNFSDLSVKLRHQLNSSEGRNYYLVYWDKLDSLIHEYGPNSEVVKVELAKVSHLFLNEVVAKLSQKTKENTLLLISADHGQVETNLDQGIYLDEDKFLVKNLKILPTGGPRDVFLHVKPGKVEVVQEYLKRKLKNKAQIIKMEEAIRAGFFGIPKIKSEYKKRLGDLLVLAKGNQLIWRKKRGKTSEHPGTHGGLSPEEMLIPFGVCGFDSLI